MAEGARLESVYTATYRGFESPPHRHILRRARTKVRAFFSHVAPTGGGREPPTGVRQLATPVGQTASPRAGCPAGASEASQSPPHRHILRRARTQVRAFFSHVAPAGGDENPRPGFDNWRSQLDRPRARERAAPTKTPGAFLNNACVGPAGARPMDGPSNGERSESIPPHRHIRDESLYASAGSFLLYSPRGEPPEKSQSRS